MANKHQKTINFIFLLGVLTILYLKVMSPIAKAVYNAFKENRFQELSDKTLLSIKSSINSLFKIFYHNRY